MHNLDRTQLELEEMEGEEEYGEEEYGEGALEWQAYEAEGDGFAGEDGLEFGEELEAPMDEAEEMELAAELLEVSDEQELEQFLGKLFGRVGRAAGGLLRSGTGRALTGILKNAARQALPMVAPGIGQLAGVGGGDVAAQLVGRAGRLLGLELEGLSPEDREFEVARQFVRFAGDAANEAALAPPTVPAATAAQTAATIAAQRHAPGLLPGPAGQGPWPPGRRGRSGRWVRRGRVIVLYRV